MEAWLAQELEQRRQSRKLAALAREADINAQRLQRMARGEAEPDADETVRLKAALRPASAGVTAPVAAPATPAPAPTTAAAPAPAPAKAVSSAPISSDVKALAVPVQGTTPDFLHRQRLIQFACDIRDWPQKHAAMRPGDMARLQSLWNETQTAISAINVRIWGTPDGPGTAAATPRPKKRKTHHSLRFLFKQAAEERLPREEIDELSRFAREAMAQGAAKGFLDAFVKAARAVLDEEDFNILLDKALASAGPGATAAIMLAELDDEEGENEGEDDGETEPEADRG